MCDNSSYEHKAELSHGHARVHLDHFQANESNDYFPPSPVTITFKSFNICRFCPPVLALSRRRSGIFMCSTYYHVRLCVNVHFNTASVKFECFLVELNFLKISRNAPIVWKRIFFNTVQLSPIHLALLSALYLSWTRTCMCSK